jgi:hypothetical protein
MWMMEEQILDAHAEMIESEGRQHASGESGEKDLRRKSTAVMSGQKNDKSKAADVGYIRIRRIV